MLTFFKRNAKIHTVSECRLETPIEGIIDAMPTMIERRNPSPQTLIFEDYEPHLGIHYDLLSKTGPSTWIINTKVRGEDRFSYPYGKYIFVAMPNGALRINRCTNHNSGLQSELTRYGDSILFAGEIVFEDFRENMYETAGRKIKHWTNHSEDYRAAPEFFKQAGLPLSCFLPVSEVVEINTSDFKP